MHAGFVHVLGDAFPLLTDPCLGLSSTYPWACAFAGLAVLLTFTLEFGLNRAFQAWAAREVAASRAAAAENDDSEAAKQEAEKSLQRRRYIAASITFEAGIIFHSIFIGECIMTSDQAPGLMKINLGHVFTFLSTACNAASR
jgi:hypothetical protein